MAKEAVNVIFYDEYFSLDQQIAEQLFDKQDQSNTKKTKKLYQIKKEISITSGEEERSLRIADQNSYRMSCSLNTPHIALLCFDLTKEIQVPKLIERIKQHQFLHPNSRIIPIGITQNKENGIGSRATHKNIEFDLKCNIDPSIKPLFISGQSNEDINTLEDEIKRYLPEVTQHLLDHGKKCILAAMQFATRKQQHEMKENLKKLDTIQTFEEKIKLLKSVALQLNHIAQKQLNDSIKQLNSKLREQFESKLNPCVVNQFDDEEKLHKAIKDLSRTSHKLLDDSLFTFILKTISIPVMSLTVYFLTFGITLGISGGIGLAVMGSLTPPIAFLAFTLSVLIASIAGMTFCAVAAYGMFKPPKQLEAVDNFVKSAELNCIGM